LSRSGAAGDEIVCHFGFLHSQRQWIWDAAVAILALLPVHAEKVAFGAADRNALHGNHFEVLAYDSLEHKQGSISSFGAISRDDPFG
jgi:hypothetical protein